MPPYRARGEIWYLKKPVRKILVHPILVQFFPSLLTIVAQFFPYFFFGHQVQNLYPVLGGYDRGRGVQNFKRHVDGWSGSNLCCLLGCCEYHCDQHRVLSFRALQAAYHM